MRKYRPIILTSILLLNTSILSLVVLLSSYNNQVNCPLQLLRGNFNNFQHNIEVCPASQFKEKSPTFLLEPSPSYSIMQATGTTLLNTTIDDASPLDFTFINNIWNDTLGSDPLVIANPSLYENGIIYNAENGLTSEALFVRIGNHGTNDSTADQTLNPPTHVISEGISAGWQVKFNVDSAYEVINVSFKWRYDAPDNAFDNFTELIPGMILDDSSDFQEIRCRIKHPTNEDGSFWLGNPVSNKNPNGTIFYRIGPTVEDDEEWVEFKGSFIVSQQVDDYILELGAYLNTREYWNEYFDVWFDDLIIEGFTDVDDTHAPQPLSIGIERTDDVSIYKFWAFLSEGLWESSIENVTVFYNKTGIISENTNKNLVLEQSNTNAAGYNQTYWQNEIVVDFNDHIDYKFIIFDKANNKYSTGDQDITIGDNSAPEITSTLDQSNIAFINHLGNGTTLISIQATDFGFGISQVFINYTIDSGSHQSIQMVEISPSYYQARLNVSYGSILKFKIILTDMADPINTRIYPADTALDYETKATTDIISPVIQDLAIYPSLTEEGRTFVNILANDPFGQIAEVYLQVKYTSNNSNHLKYSKRSLILDNSTGYWILPSSVDTPGGALLLPFTWSYENYSITFYVKDVAGLTTNQTIYYTVDDEVAPKVSIFDFDYSIPGILKVWVQAIDKGSGIASLSLERKTTSGWNIEIPLKNSSRSNMFVATINTNWIGNERVELRISAEDRIGNSLTEEGKNLTIKTYVTQYFATTSLGLLVSELLVIAIVLSVFMAVKIVGRRRIITRRRVRFDLALGRSEKLAYLGEEAIFGFMAAYGQTEGVASALIWEPRLIGTFYPYLKDLIEKANNSMSFVMQARPRDQTTFIDFKIEEIGCSAITFAYPVSTLPQQWLSTLTLDHVPMGGGQGVLLLMLLMRERWADVANNFQEEVTDGMLEIKNLLISGEGKQTIVEKAREFRLFISGTIEVMDEIDIETDEISDEIMSEFEAEFLGSHDEDTSLNSNHQSETSEDISDTDKKYW